MCEASIENAPNNIDRGSDFRRRKTGNRRMVRMANYIFTIDTLSTRIVRVPSPIKRCNRCE